MTPVQTLKRVGINVCRGIGPYVPGDELRAAVRRRVLTRLMDRDVLPGGLRPCHTRECKTPVLADPYIYTHHTVFWFRRLYESHTAIFLRRWLAHGDTAIDIGMNLGHFTTLASELVGAEGKVVAFEPNPVLCEQVGLHLASCAIRNVEIRNLALGPSEGEVRLAVPSDTGSSFVEEITDRTSSDGMTHFKVRMQRGDDEMACIPAERLVLKIDVEGGEFEVLDGLRQTLATRVTAGQVEISPQWLGEGKLHAIEDLFEACGLKTYLAAPGSEPRPVAVSEVTEQADVWFVRNTAGG